MKIVIHPGSKKIVRIGEDGTQILSNFNENQFRHFYFFKKWLGMLFDIRAGMPPGTTRMHVWHIAAPKSGSTWLTSILTELLKWKVCPLIPDYDRREQEIEITNLLYASMHASCFYPHQHCRYSHATRMIINRLEITPILQYRNIFDTVVSFYDHCNGGELAFPMAYMDEENWNELDSTKRMDFIIDLMVPWYFNFYGGWFSSDLFRDKKLILVSYEDLASDPHAEVKKILNRIGVERTDEEICSAIEITKGKETRKNVGTFGRGSVLSPEQKQRIRNMASYYPNIDFGILGL